MYDFSWIESAVDQIGGWVGLDLRSPGKRNADKLARDQYDLQRDEFDYQRQLDQQNYEEQRRQYEKNFGFQQEKYDYDKALQETIFNREDNSVQRRTADLKAAGINPILAAGQGASAGAVVSTQAPQGEAAYKQNNARVPDPSMMIDVEMKKQGVMQMVMNALKMKADIDHTKADTERIKMQSSNESWQKDIAYEKLDLDRDRFNIELRRHGLDIKRLDNESERIVIEKDKVDLQRNAQLLRHRQVEISEALGRARIGLIDEQVISEQLYRIGLDVDISQKLLDYDVSVHDFLYILDAGIRAKDNTNPLERIANSIGRSFGNSAMDTTTNELRNRYLGRR